jgi:hypothetical protein
MAGRSSKNLLPMIRIAITAAYHAICSTLPQDAPLWPVERQGGQFLICVEAAALDSSAWPCGGEESAIATSSFGWRRIKTRSEQSPHDPTRAASA